MTLTVDILRGTVGCPFLMLTQEDDDMITIQYPAVAYTYGDSDGAPMTRPYTRQYSMAQETPRVMAVDCDLARQLDDAMAEALAEKGINAFFHAASYLTDQEITAAAVTAGCTVIK